MVFKICNKLQKDEWLKIESNWVTQNEWLKIAGTQGDPEKALMKFLWINSENFITHHTEWCHFTIKQTSRSFINLMLSFVYLLCCCRSVSALPKLKEGNTHKTHRHTTAISLPSIIQERSHWINVCSGALSKFHFWTLLSAAQQAVSQR